jgi:RND superfamily putative drug exporter
VTGFFPALGDAVARFRWLVLALWIVVAGVSVLGAKEVRHELISGGINAPGSESERGNQLLEQEFNRKPTRSAAAVFTSSRFVVTDQQYRDSVTRALDEAAKVEGVERILSFYNTGLERLNSEDKHTTYAVVSFTGSEEEAKDLIPTVREALHSTASDLDQNYLIGFPATSYDISEGSSHDLHKAELYSLPLTVFLLLFVFGTVVAAGLPVVLGAAAVLTALAALFLVAQRMETSIFAMNTASMIGLGLGIDFSLLMVSRYREELARGMSPHQATVRTVGTAGQSIVFSGLTVMLGLSVMLLYDLVLVRSIALGMLLVAGLAVIGAVTLLPALLCLFGRQVNAFNLIPGRKAQTGPSSGQGRWHSWSLLVMRRPWLFLGMTLLILIGMGIPTKDLYAIGTGGAQGAPGDSESRQGFDLMNQSFPVGEVSPISIVLKTPRTDGALEPAFREGIFRLTQILEQDPRVARVESLANLNPTLTLEQFKALPIDQLLADPRQRAFVAQYLNVDGGRNTVQIAVISKFTDTDRETSNLLRDMRGTMVPGIPELRGAEMFATGTAALNLDYRDKLYGQFPTLVGLVLVVTYIVLVLFFHSLLLPLKAILMNLVSILASYGFLVMVFQWGILDDVLGFEHLGRTSMLVPVILFSVLFGLSTDYEVFLLSRVKELYKRTGDNEHSVAEGLEHTAGIITAAGLIMIVVFGSFAMGDVLVIKELGVGLAIAVLLDSTIIRVMLVPASMKLMGNLNWWMPKSLDWIPEISEGGELDEPVSRPAMGASVLCPTCRAALPPRARFCGRCGSVIRVAPAAEPVRSFVGRDGGGETLVVGGHASDAAEFGARSAGLVAGMPSSGTGLRRVPIMLRIGNVHQKAWLSLRDCQVEKDPSAPSVPIVAIEGVEILPLSGQDPPEIQVRNARIRL